MRKKYTVQTHRASPGFFRPYLLTILCMLLTVTEARAFIDDIWQEYTPGKNIIGNNEDGRGNYLHYPYGELQQLKEWYFYKAHVLGTLSTATGTGYFILNETNNRLVVFDTKAGFENYAKANELEPWLIRRYDYKWSLFPKESSLNYTIGLFFLVCGSIPLLLFQLLVFGIVCIVMLLSGQLMSFLRSMYELVLLGGKALAWVSLYTVPVVMLVWYVKGAFPQSI